MWMLIAGWVASALVFSTFFMRTMLPLRVAAIASNAAFMSYALLGLEYGHFDRLYPILVLHASLLPLNVARLRELRTAVSAVAAADGEEALRALVPYMKPERHPRGTTLFRRGDAADRLYVIREGTVAFPEAAEELAAGAVFGEVGLLAPHSRRTVTAVCASDCSLLTVRREKTLELCYQDPGLAMLLARLVAGYVPQERPHLGAGPDWGGPRQGYGYLRRPSRLLELQRHGVAADRP
jgi:CRP/FNR family transcriptional regulator, cyclic AMP receptor protein